MTSLATGHRYTVEQASYGWDVIDTETGESVGICSTEKDATKTAQVRIAFVLANAVRRARADLRKEVSALGALDARERVAALLIDPPREINSLTITDLLIWIRHVQTTQAGRLLRSFGYQFDWNISEDRRVGEMTERQRVALADYLRGERVDGRVA